MQAALRSALKETAILSTWALRGVYDASRRFESEALAGMDEVGNETTRANILYWCALACLHRGAFSRASRLFSRALEVAKREELYNLMPAICMFLSSMIVSNGYYNEGLALAEEALRLGEERALGPVELVGRTGRALALAHLGRRSEALEDIEASPELSMELGASHEASHVRVVAGIVCLMCGECRSALEHFRSGLSVSDRNGYASAAFWCRLGIMAADTGERDLDADIREVTSMIEACGSEPVEAYSGVPAHMILAALHARRGAVDEAREALAEAIRITESDGGIAWCWTSSPAPSVQCEFNDIAYGGEVSLMKKEGGSDEIRANNDRPGDIYRETVHQGVEVPGFPSPGLARLG